MQILSPGLGLLLSLLICSPLSADERPNVLLIMTDDQGYGDLSCHGNPIVKTRFMDQIAKEGVEFTRFYVSPVCAPTRAGLLTGRYNLRSGVWGVTAGRETMELDEVTLAEAFQHAGYRTGMFGKWHLGEHYPYVPHAQGFEEFVGFRLGHWNQYFNTTLERNGKPIATQGYITDLLTDKAIDFIERNKTQPFFCYVPYNAPHTPWQVPDEYYELYRDVPETERSAYAMIHCIDDNMGRLLRKLDELQLSEQTIVIFLTDNGPNDDRYNAGMKGRKGSVHEGGVRVPFFIRWPGHLPAGKTIDTIAAHIDVFPTLMELCGITPPKTKPLDGMSLVPLLQEGSVEWPDRSLYVFRSQRGKNSPYPGSLRTQRYRWVGSSPGQDELYDMMADPGQKMNIASDHPELTRTFRENYLAKYEEVISETGYRVPPIPVGYWEENPVIPSAPQAELEGVKYKGSAGWANDYIVGWDQVENRSVKWHLAIAQAGTYRIALQYRCPQEELGSEVQIHIGGQHLTAKITEPIETPPAEHPDRNPRKEVYELDWGLLEMGTLNLPRGETTLTVKALTKPGQEVMTLKGVRIDRLE